MYSLHLIYSHSLIQSSDVALFCPHGAAVAVSRPVAFLLKVIRESNVRAYKFALPR
jgi:hypothetical protein